MRILDAATRAAVAAATSQQAQCEALTAPWAGGNVTARLFAADGTTLLRTVTLAPWTINASTPRGVVAGAHLADTPASTGTPGLWVFRAGGVDICDEVAGLAGSAISHAGPVRTLCTPTLQGVVFTARSSLPVAPPAVPSWVASITPGQMAIYSGGGSVVTNNLRSVVHPLYDQFYSVKIVNDYSGAAANPWWGTHGAKVFKGGGHSATNDNSTMVLEYGASTMTWRRIVDPSPWTYSGTGSPRDTSLEYTSQVDFTWGEYTVDGKPMSLHSYGLLCVQGPAAGGAANGTLWLPAILAGNYGSHKTQAAHRLPFSTTDAGPLWARGSATAPSISGDPTGMADFVPAQRRVYLNYGNDNAVVRWLDTVTQSWTVGSGVGFNVAQHLYAAGECHATLVAVPERDLLLMLGRSNATGNLVIQWMSVAAGVTQPTLGGTAQLSQALALELPWSSATWCPDNNRLLIMGASGDLGAIYEVEIPATLTQPWTVTRAPMGAGQTLSNTLAGSVGNVWGKWSYDRAVRAVVFVPLVARQGLGNDQVYVYRPRNT
jgi:hypothetical protein